MRLKLLQLIKPNFGSISICGYSLGDPRKENLLDSYDKDGVTKVDKNSYLYGILQLRELGFRGGFVRLEFDSEDKLCRSVITVTYQVPEARRYSYISTLIDYLSESQFFDNVSSQPSSFCFRNAINEFLIQLYDQEIVIELYRPVTFGLEPGEHFESGAKLTLEMISRKEKDSSWETYCEEKRKEELMEWQKIHHGGNMSSKKEDVDIASLLAGTSESLDGTSAWLECIKNKYSGKPRLYSVLTKGTVLNQKDGGHIVLIRVANEAQKHYIEEKILAELTSGLEKVAVFASSPLTIVIDVTEK